jgi:hypothetical protein
MNHDKKTKPPVDTYTVRLQRKQTNSFISVKATGRTRNDAMADAEKSMPGWYAVNAEIA